MGTSPENIALIPAVSYGAETAAKNIRLRKNGELLLPAGEFPSHVYPWLAAAEESGAIVRFVSRESGASWAESFEAQIGPATQVVCVSPCDWSNGRSFGLAQLSRTVRKFGARLVLDLSQSLGAASLDLNDIKPDFAYSVGYKWQLGPYGLSYMYVSADFLNGRPIENNWINRRHSEDFSRLTEYRREYQPGARRFDSGQHSSLILNHMALGALTFINELGVEKINTHIRRLNLRLMSGLGELGFEVPAISETLGHMFGAKPPMGFSASALGAALSEQKVFVSSRGENLRFSPHIYNDDADVTRALSAVRSIIS